MIYLRFPFVGDDLLVSNPEKVRRGLQDKTSLRCWLKLNQFASITETIEAVELCHRPGGGQWHRIARARRKMQPYQISPLHSIMVKSKLEFLLGRIVLQNIPSCYPSKWNWGTMANTRTGAPLLIQG